MEKIQKMITQLGREVKNLIESCLELSWYYRGGVSYSEFLHLSAGERSAALDFINERMKKIAKSQYPVY